MSIDFSSIKKVLVSKLRHHGDVLLTSSVFSLLKSRFPHLQIDAYIYKETLPMLSGNPHISNYILYDKAKKKEGVFQRYKHEIDNLLKIRKERYDLVINFTEGDRGALAAFFSKAQYKVGFDPDKTGFFGKRKVFTHLVRVCPNLRHTVERHLDVLRYLGIDPQEHEKELLFPIEKDVIEKVSSVLRLHDVPLENFVVVHPVSRWMFKCWKETYVAKIIEKLSKEGFTVVLTSGPDKEEVDMNSRIKGYAKDAKILDLSGKITLKELGALIQLSKLLFCVDSVPMHISSALKKPVVALFGPTSEVTWAPWKNPFSKVVFRKDFSCRPCYMPGCGGSGKSECLDRITVEEVSKAIDEVLERAYPMDQLIQLRKSLINK